MGEKVIAVSGGFDPIHVGHLRMMQDAAQHGRLVVIVNSDEWLLKKKGYVFMPWEERAELIGAYDFVDEVVKAKDDNRTVVESLEEIKPDSFANGGDRGNVNTPEVRYCRENGIEMMWGVILSDGIVDDFEANLMRRINGLLYVSGEESALAKQRALSQTK